jgi:hypothetical protein
MTITPIDQELNIEDEYIVMPLDASETGTEVCAYGDHLVPLDAAGDFDLPLLIAQSADASELPAEWEKWGRVNRSEKADAWHTYASDAKFATLLRDPNKLIDTGAKYACEVNVSTFHEDPLPVGLAGLWRKRCVSRIWQDAGVKVFVDLHVVGFARGFVMEGVPRTHQLYCTRYKKNDLNGDYLGIEAVEQDYDLVMEHVSEDVTPLFVVYGVPSSLVAECEERGWFCLPNAAVKAKEGR